ncbi:hypothetical protein NE237_004701 [Protea cynaroides]|uniref:Uncharacterized protein n=1 Tax=Protea cynaroides TaxID=273540 RepID=A0A9Q0KJ91_9MAGN|nr:hypothetical protein NE237_004701 [Protea cynaroides]
MDTTCNLHINMCTQRRSGLISKILFAQIESKCFPPKIGRRFTCGLFERAVPLFPGLELSLITIYDGLRNGDWDCHGSIEEDLLFLILGARFFLIGTEKSDPRF